jgi:hypothetical protein
MLVPPGNVAKRRKIDIKALILHHRSGFAIGC